MLSIAIRALLYAVAVMAATEVAAAERPSLPPPWGPETPRVEPVLAEDGLYQQSWFVHSFLDLKEDYAEAELAGKRFAVLFEQRGCIYCARMHKEVLAHRFVNDYVRDNFHIVQLNLWGSREVVDFDGTKLPEKRLAERWGVLYTPTVVFFKDALSGLGRQWGPPLEVARLPLGFEADTFYDIFAWVRAKVYEHDPSFQRFHVARHNEREALKKANAARTGTR
ncbi:MAG TPA: thioredoxin family protein [Hyphomicrobiaceae bacterium]|nr:thioredoxin family protein [Hyphomicrobiaceae bacterium]